MNQTSIILLEQDETLPEVRCPNCNRLLFKGRIIQIEVKCPKCHFCYSLDYSGEKMTNRCTLTRGEENIDKTN